MKTKCNSLYLYLYLYLYGFLFLISIVFVYIFWNKIVKVKRSFVEGFTWSKPTLTEFTIYQRTANPNTQFDLQMVQEQASESEAQHLFETGYWPWKKDTEYLYMDAVSKNKIVAISPQASLDFVKRVYNENAAKQLLSWNTKEGAFLLNGGINGPHTKIQCSNGKMTKTTLNGYNLWNGYKNIDTSVISDAEIPNEMPGFSFIKEPCNPCIGLENDYSCPFQLKMENDKYVSPIWQKLWNL